MTYYGSGNLSEVSRSPLNEARNVFKQLLQLFLGLGSVKSKSSLLDDVRLARRKIEQWRREYNEDRPHGSLGIRTPQEFLGDFDLNRAEQMRF